VLFCSKSNYVAPAAVEADQIGVLQDSLIASLQVLSKFIKLRAEFRFKILFTRFRPC
jgi:hypothetical protein